MIVPDGHEWEGLVDLSRVDASKREKVLSQLIDLLGYGMNAWGKTKTSAETWITGAARMDGAPSIDGNHYVVTLQTPAILCDPDDLNEASGKQELSDSYEKVWAELSGGTVKLVRYFAQQTLAGGYYLHERFQSKKAYYPWLLTDAGSVFVLEAINGGAGQMIDDWVKHGLKLPKWAVERYGSDSLPGDHWKCCPYIPENGYGEIAVNIQLKNFPEVDEEGNNE
jgi:hypothetical protein